MIFMDIIPKTSPKSLTSETNFSNDLLIVDAYSKIPKLYGMEIINTEGVMHMLDMFQDVFGKVEEFGWWELERISSDADTQFNSTDFHNKCQTCGVQLTLATLEHQEMNGRVEVKRRTLGMIAHSLMVHV